MSSVVTETVNMDSLDVRARQLIVIHFRSEIVKILAKWKEDTTTLPLREALSYQRALQIITEEGDS